LRNPPSSVDTIAVCVKRNVLPDSLGSGNNRSTTPSPGVLRWGISPIFEPSYKPIKKFWEFGQWVSLTLSASFRREHSDEAKSGLHIEFSKSIVEQHVPDLLQISIVLSEARDKKVQTGIPPIV
jgi:hypothetical protein